MGEECLRIKIKRWLTELWVCACTWYLVGHLMFPAVFLAAKCLFCEYCHNREWDSMPNWQLDYCIPLTQASLRLCGTQCAAAPASLPFFCKGKRILGSSVTTGCKNSLYQAGSVCARCLNTLHSHPYTTFQMTLTLFGAVATVQRWCLASQPSLWPDGSGKYSSGFPASNHLEVSYVWIL